MPNVCRILVVCVVLWQVSGGGRYNLLVEEFFYCYKISELERGWYYFSARDKKVVLVKDLPSSHKS